MKIDIHQKSPFFGYVNDNQRGDRVDVSERQKYLNLPAYSLVEPYRDSGNRKYYDYLLSISNTRLLSAEAGSVCQLKHSIDAQKLRRIHLAGINFWRQSHSTQVNRFLHYAESVRSDNTYLADFFKDYRKTFSYGSDCQRLIVIDNEEKLTKDDIDQALATVDLSRDVDVIFIGRHTLCGGLESVCKEHYLPLTRVRSIRQTGSVNCADFHIKTIASKIACIVSRDSVIDSDISRLLKVLSQANPSGVLCG